MKSLITVNYHFTEKCNFRCKFCFAGHGLCGKELNCEEAMLVIKGLAVAGCQKINFVGGEPTLCPWLGKLIHYAKSLGLVTSIVTNGTGLTDAFLEDMLGALDWIGMSVDSLNETTLKALGRQCSGQIIDDEFYYNKVKKINNLGYKLKLNTVVNAFNYQEDMSCFINHAAPTRWKLFQVLTENDMPSLFSITSEQFESFCCFHQSHIRPSIQMVPESNNLMRGTYTMIDPIGRFYDNITGEYRYSDPILEVGIKRAFEQVIVDYEKMVERGGVYSW
jgi:radical S-adenosyl methionine domain-containing protein 2